MKQGEIYAKNGYDFCIHMITDGMIYGVLYPSERRGRVTEPDTPIALVKHSVARFLAEKPELVGSVEVENL